MSEENYMSNLSKVVGEACDRWLASRGFEKKGWKKQNDEFFARNKKTPKQNNGNDQTTLILFSGTPCCGLAWGYGHSYGFTWDTSMKTRIHVNQHKIRSNAKTGDREPVLTVKTYKSNTYCKTVNINGPCKVVYSPDNPLPCGAKVWIETEEGVVCD